MDTSSDANALPPEETPQPTVDDIALAELKDVAPEEKSSNHVGSDIC